MIDLSQRQQCLHVKKETTARSMQQHTGIIFIVKYGGSCNTNAHVRPMHAQVSTMLLVHTYFTIF